MTRPRRIEVEIEALVLEGVRAGDAEIVGAALERELGRLAREGGLPAAGPVRPGPAQVELRPGEPPALLGARLAGVIHGRLVP